jgi:hypothetical protein
MFVWGATTFGLYTLALVALGSGFTRQMLVAGNAALVLMSAVFSSPCATGTSPVTDAAGKTAALGNEGRGIGAAYVRKGRSDEETVAVEPPHHNCVCGSLSSGDYNAHPGNHDAKREAAGAGG